MKNLTLILGGAASGKSAHGEALARATGLPPVYLATGQALDGEMAEKIARHQARRGPEWQLVEAPLDLCAPLRNVAQKVVLIDCLTLWLSNHLQAGHNVAAETERLLGAIAASGAEVIAVSNELGLGLVPADALSRRFREAQGALNQRFAQAAQRVTFVAAGLPLPLKAPA